LFNKNSRNHQICNNFIAKEQIFKFLKTPENNQKCNKNTGDIHQFEAVRFTNTLAKFISEDEILISKYFILIFKIFAKNFRYIIIL